MFDLLVHFYELWIRWVRHCLWFSSNCLPVEYSSMLFCVRVKNFTNVKNVYEQTGSRLVSFEWHMLFGDNIYVNIFRRLERNVDAIPPSLPVH